MSLPALAREQSELRELHAGKGVVLVPTMGAIHEGHLALVRQARSIADAEGMMVCASLFVNPLQFGPGEDYQSYPRRLEEDLGALSGLAQTCFAPRLEDLYPGEQEIFVHAPGLGNELCGASRPGHFQGVLTVVHKLFSVVRPSAAVFGEKDYQQQVLIRKMVEQLDLRVRIETVPTVRERDGLALSSRNESLDEHGRRKAPLLHSCIAHALERIVDGKDSSKACDEAAARLEESGFAVDYVECRALDLAGYKGHEQGCVVLVAATIGQVRLIDNVCHRP